LRLLESEEKVMRDDLLVCGVHSWVKCSLKRMSARPCQKNHFMDSIARRLFCPLSSAMTTGIGTIHILLYENAEWMYLDEQIANFG
jgi:hypothetical protein